MSLTNVSTVLREGPGPVLGGRGALQGTRRGGTHVWMGRSSVGPAPCFSQAVSVVDFISVSGSQTWASGRAMCGKTGRKEAPSWGQQHPD